MIFNGIERAEELRRVLIERAEKHTIKPKLGVVFVGESTVSESYIEKKIGFGASLGVHVEIIRLQSDATLENIAYTTKSLCESAEYDGVLVQLPLPDRSMTDAVLGALTPLKDVDGLGEAPRVHAPIVRAIRDVIDSTQKDLRTQSVVVIGRGRLVGKPLLEWMDSQNIEPTVFTKDTPLDKEILLKADVIISGSGTPYLITPDMVKEGAVLVDAGTSEAGGKIQGDIHPDCATKASLYTPVPGGVGPLTVAYLFVNLFDLFEGTQES